MDLSDVTLSVVSHGHGELLDGLFRDLAALPGMHRARALLTLNLSSEGFDAKSFAPMQIDVLRNERPRGFGANHNAAFEHCTTPWFAVLNPDLRFPTDPFPPLLLAATSMPDVALFTPKIVGANGNAEDHVRTNLTPFSLLQRRVGTVAHVDDSAPSKLPGPFYWVAGMFMLFRADAFRKLGGFDERFFLYCEDYEICARLYVRGNGVAVIPGARVVHDARRDSHRSLKHLRWHLSSLAKVWTSRAFWDVVRRTYKG